MIFILGSPRTGSTLIYQIMINFYNLCYFTNMTNICFYRHPFVGTLLGRLFNHTTCYRNKYGKTKGMFGPSEGSYIFRNWFGTGNKILSGKKEHMLNTFKHIDKFINDDIVMKNAWNCFRIEELSKLFPDAKFIWIRRDIMASAYSDLKARCSRGGQYVWNSAPTFNYREIQKMPYWQQVVEQQYEYNETIKTDLEKFYPDNYIELWYESLCGDLNTQIGLILNFFNLKSVKKVLPIFKIKKYNADTDFIKIYEYVRGNPVRFNGYIR